MTDVEDLTVDHWWWRPGWRVGRSFYTWHVTFADSPEIQQLVERFAPGLSMLSTVSPVSVSGLHITVQGVGFTDEVTEADVKLIAQAADERCAGLEPLELCLGPIAVDREALGLPVRNPEGLHEVRRRLQLAIGDVWGSDHIPELESSFKPHLTLGYSTGCTPIAAIVNTLTNSGVDQVTVTPHVSTVSLIELNRDHKRYEWRDIAAVKLRF